MTNLRNTLNTLATPQKAPIDKVALAVSYLVNNPDLVPYSEKKRLMEAFPSPTSVSTKDGFDIYEEIQQQHKVVIKLREQLIDPNTGEIQAKIPTRAAKETISSFTTFLSAVMRVEDKVDRTRRLKQVEDITVAVVKEFLDAEQQDEFINRLEAAYTNT